MKPKRSSKAKGLSVDRISILPENIIETILCLVPLRDAVRTSILSQKWRYNWTKIPKLVFDEKDMFTKSANERPSERVQLVKHELARPARPTDRSEYVRMRLAKRCKTFNAIYQVLLLHQGPLVEFTLDMNAKGICVEIDQIITHLSKHNTVKKFTLKLTVGERWTEHYNLPSSFFSLYQLTDIYLHGCNLEIKPTFSRFVNLTNVILNCVSTYSKTLVDLVSSSRLLKTFRLEVRYDDIETDSDNVTLVELFEALPMIEHLSLWRDGMRNYANEKVPRDLPTALVNLKYLFLEEMLFVEKFMFSILGLLIRSSPYLEKLKLEVYTYDFDLHESEKDALIPGDYSDIWLEHLNELEIVKFPNSKSKPALVFVKLILAKSPVLKKVNILLDYDVTKDKEIKLLKCLLRCPRVSPVVEIIVEHTLDTY